MKNELTGLSQRYATALHKYLKRRLSSGLLAATRLGRDAVALGLATPELARMHQRALATLKPATRKNGLAKHAETFFATATAPIIETHRAGGSNEIALERLNDLTSRRAAELTATNRELRKGVIHHQAVGNAFEKSGRSKDKSLGEALKLEKRLQKAAHDVLAAQEDERAHISHELHDEIAQTLLGINVRLVSLKQKARTDPAGLKNEIASARRLVVKSAKSVRRLARELHKTPPAHGNYYVSGP